MTIGERITRLNEIPMEQMRDLNDIWGKPRTFKCCQCGKTVELGLTQRTSDWQYKAISSHNWPTSWCCSWNCLQEWRREHEKRGTHATNGRAYTPEEDEMILRLRDQGASWAEIGKACGRKPTAVQAHYNNALAWEGRR